MKNINGFYGLLGPRIGYEKAGSLYELFLSDGIIQGVFFQNGNLTFIKHLIRTEKVKFERIDTVTLYLSPQRQSEYFDYVANLKPRRVIFNPGTENPAFENYLTEKSIEPIEACTLVMLATGQY